MMIAEEYLGSSRLFRRLKSEPHGQLVELYAARLTDEGRARHGTWRCLSLVGDLLSWIGRSRSKMSIGTENCWGGRPQRHRTCHDGGR